MPVGVYGARAMLWIFYLLQGLFIKQAHYKELAKENFYSSLKEKTEQLVFGIVSRAQAAHIPH